MCVITLCASVLNAYKNVRCASKVMAPRGGCVGWWREGGGV